MEEGRIEKRKIEAKEIEVKLEVKVGGRIRGAGKIEVKLGGSVAIEVSV